MLTNVQLGQFCKNITQGIFGNNFAVFFGLCSLFVQILNWKMLKNDSDFESKKLQAKIYIDTLLFVTA